jgi:hypothetical protein
MKNYGFIFAILLLVALGLGGVGHGAVNSWSGQAEVQVPFSEAITAGTLATLMSATSTKAHNVRALTVTNTASGFVRLYSGGTTPIGARLIGTFGVIANTPLVLTEENLGTGVVTTVGDALMVDATTGTVSIQARVREDLKSPR